MDNVFESMKLYEKLATVRRGIQSIKNHKAYKSITAFRHANYQLGKLLLQEKAISEALAKLYKESYE